MLLEFADTLSCVMDVNDSLHGNLPYSAVDCCAAAHNERKTSIPLLTYGSWSFFK